MKWFVAINVPKTNILFSVYLYLFSVLFLQSGSCRKKEYVAHPQLKKETITFKKHSNDDGDEKKACLL